MFDIPERIDSDFIRENYTFDDGKPISVGESAVIIRSIGGPSIVYGRSITKSRENFKTWLQASSLLEKRGKEESHQ